MNCLDITNDTSLQGSINYLYSLFHHLDIYEIRNVVSHPNRPFWDCYWYRIASIASDPVNEILGFENIKKTLICAEKNKISDPPEEWINKIIWQIPNNLPEMFEHELTGLIGRTKELNELKKHISNQRINTIALVAPGGAGKTALALDLLNTIISTPAYTKHVSVVIYVTMKTEKLTADGVVPLDEIESISELKDKILQGINHVYDECYLSFIDAVNGKSNDKVLLCIDNLETLLRDKPSTFDDLNNVLPSDWKVLVTSRVAISNATIIPLSNLNKNSAVHLARTYHFKRGGSFTNELQYENITKKCHYNPLAIRLSIDLVIKGKDIPESLNIANKEIAAFSYNNLIEALSKLAVEILECIFVEGISTRFSLCEHLGKNLDEISEGIGELSRTSLISRVSIQEGESYTLNDSVRELLLLSPRNLSIRTSVQEIIEKRRMLSQEIDNRQTVADLPVWEVNHIDINTPESLKILVTKFNQEYKKATRDSDVSVRLYRQLKEMECVYENNATFHRTMGRSLELLKDKISARKHYKKAAEIAPENPTNIFLLAESYHNSKLYQDAYVTYGTLISQIWGDKNPLECNIQFGNSLYRGYYLSLLYDAKWQRVLDETKSWKDSLTYRSVFGTYRAAAWKRKMEHTVDSDPEGTISSLLSATTILSDVFRTNGYSLHSTIQAIKIIDEIEYTFSRSNYISNFSDDVIKLLNFSLLHIYDISTTLSRRDFKPLIRKLSLIKIKDNPFLLNNAAEYIGSGVTDIYDEIRNDGLIEVMIEHRPTKPSFLFAIDARNVKYFLHYDKFKSKNWSDWIKLEIKQRLLIIPDVDTPSDKSAINAKEIYLAEV